jgi:hypothetical protein
MTISFTNMIRILCYKYGAFEKADFVEAWLAVDPDADAANIESLRSNYFSGSQPKKNWINVVNMLDARAERQAVDDAKLPADERPPDLRPIGALLNRRMTTAEFIEICHVRFPDLKANGVLNDDAALDWERRYNGMHFMEQLIAFEEDKEGRKLLKAMLGTYHLYRRHSVLPGILREVVVVRERRYGHAEGIYYQYNRGKPGSWNEIKFNVFYAGFYVLAFGAFKDDADDSRAGPALPGADKAKTRGAANPLAEPPRKGRMEILEVKILIENALRIRDKVDCEQGVFPGILTGIYDYGNILLAERVLLRRICDATERPPSMKPERLVSDNRATVSEYYSVLDAIDNASNGHTLSIRPIHLEKPYLRPELLPPAETFLS